MIFIELLCKIWQMKLWWFVVPLGIGAQLCFSELHPGDRRWWVLRRDHRHGESWRPGDPWVGSTTEIATPSNATHLKEYQKTSTGKFQQKFGNSSRSSIRNPKKYPIFWTWFLWVDNVGHPAAEAESSRRSPWHPRRQLTAEETLGTWWTGHVGHGHVGHFLVYIWLYLFIYIYITKYCYSMGKNGHVQQYLLNIVELRDGTDRYSRLVSTIQF